MTDRTHLKAALSKEGNAILIKASGPCNMASCPALKEHLVGYKKPALNDIYFDLSEAESIDSTFTGMLLSMSRRKADALAPDLHLVSPAPRVCEAIQSMHISKFFDIRDALPATDGPWQEIQLESTALEPLAETVVACHKAIIDADARNRAAFGRVVEGLESEMEHTRDREDHKDKDG